jgi:rubrerythrin
VIIYTDQLSTAKPRYEIADIFQQYGEAYRQSHHVSYEQQKAIAAITQCRTAVLGGHVDECDQCGVLRISYNSCRNRHCPKCGALSKARWLEARQRDLLPIAYFHVVFTIAHTLNALARCNPTRIYDLLFASAAKSLKAFGARYLGGEIGIVAVLHTWGQDLGQHIHLHCIVTGGGLSFDTQRWQACPPGFLFPLLPLSKAFRDTFCAGLARLHQRQQLVFAGDCAGLESADNFAGLMAELQAKDWQVYAKESFGGPDQVFNYLGRYVHRVAISNNRLVSIENDQVRFQWRDNRDSGRLKEMTLPAVEFMRRFLLHVLPTGFVRTLRGYYGLFSNGQRQRKLKRGRELLGVSATPEPVVTEKAADLLKRLTGVDMHQCPVCGLGQMRRKQELESAYALFVRARAQSALLVDEGVAV